MPEGPQVKRIVDGLNANIRGTRILNIISHDPRYSPSGTQLRGSAAEFLKQSKAAILTIGEIKCHGKFIYLRIRGTNPVEDQWRVFHTLGMGGGWSVSRKPKKNLCLELVLESRTRNGSFSVYYYDSRRFGTFKFLEGDEGILSLQRKLTKELGPDLLDQENPISRLDFQARLKARKGTWTIAQGLMNQSVVAGIGNYLKAEILHTARVSPHRTLESLTEDEIARLHAASLDHINRDYQSKIDRTAPRYKFTVYNQRSCGDCGKAVKREKTADKRTSHWCPACITQTENSELPDDWHWH
jgi:formamidopyrimidine-DNA glycosylase